MLRLPPYAPELNPAENVWEYLRGNTLSNQGHALETEGIGERQREIDRHDSRKGRREQQGHAEPDDKHGDGREQPLGDRDAPRGDGPAFFRAMQPVRLEIGEILDDISGGGDESES